MEVVGDHQKAPGNRMSEDLQIKIDDFVFVLYLTALIFSFYKYRALNSTVLTLINLVIFDYIFVNIREPLKSYVMHCFNNGSGDLGIFLWYAPWAALNALFIYTLYKFHVWFNRSTTFFSDVCKNTYFILFFLQFAGYIDHKVFNFDWFHLVYTYAIPVINITLFCFVFFVLTFKDKKYDDS